MSPSVALKLTFSAPKICASIRVVVGISSMSQFLLVSNSQRRNIQVNFKCWRDSFTLLLLV